MKRMGVTQFSVRDWGWGPSCGDVRANDCSSFEHLPKSQRKRSGELAKFRL